MERLTGAPFPLPSELGVEIPSWQEQAIMDGLDLFVQKRIQNMDELWTRLYVQPQTEAPGPSATDSKSTRSSGSEHTVVMEHSGSEGLDWENRVLMGLQRIRSICSDIYHRMKEL